LPTFGKMDAKRNTCIELKRSEKRKDTFDCLISLKEISPQFLLVLENEISNIISAQSKSLEGCIILSSETVKQLQDLNQLIQLHKELSSQIVKNIKFNA
jgi:hypothetical protein